MRLILSAMLAATLLVPAASADATYLVGGDCWRDPVSAGTWDYYSYEVWGNDELQAGTYPSCEGSTGESTGVAVRYQQVGVWAVVSPGNLVGHWEIQQAD